ncbi:cyclase family protein [Streptomyces mangrovisoli]|uniref:Cyclase n=1 Tax=Streptomyces mangrovisoli TaxID=1428628 RepID=A0A1J4NSM9_9ACTN|nr:cyclase family protein [Streptomyces mangrovisoli]OIJ65489.1 cyclase [Streptomyces mangrovisoli]
MTTASQDANTSPSHESWDRTKPREAIAAAADAHSNWGRWGEEDVHGTVNFITEDKRQQAAGLIRTGRTYSLSIEFGPDGPQNGVGRTNPIWAARALHVEDSGDVPFPPHGGGGVDDIVIMPLQAATQWDSLGHIFDRGRAWNGREARNVASYQGDAVTGIHTMAEPVVSRGVLLDVGRMFGTDGELPDGFAITSHHLQETIEAQGASSAVGRGDILLVRTGRLTRARREGWGTFAGGDAPGLSFETVGWLHGSEIAAIATDTWGVEVRPNEFDVPSFQPLHQVAIPHLGLLLGEIWNLDDLADACAEDGRYDFFLAAPPIPFYGAAGAPVNPVAVR